VRSFASNVSIPGRWCLAAASCVVVASIVPWWCAWALAATVLVVAYRRAPAGAVALASLVVMGSLAGTAADRRTSSVAAESLPEGRFDVTVAIRRDPVSQRGGLAIGVPSSLDDAPWSGPPVGIGPLPDAIVAGDTVVVTGRIRPGVRRLGPDLVAGIVDVVEVHHTEHTRNPFVGGGNAVRQRVLSTFASRDSPDAAAGIDDAGAALMSGLLVGDTSRLPAAAMEDLRRAGLAHYVAVSGSNVALFLGAWWIIGLPLAIHPRVRAVFGLAGLVVFVVATRWEPSVVRASVMAGSLLIGGLIGLPIDPWMALGLAVTVLVLASANLATSVGFLLSVLATGGVLVGVYLVRHRRPSWLWTPLGATVGAQIAVAPLILAVFGSIPLVAPISNLLAAPLVTVATVVGITAVVVPVSPIVTVAVVCADAVLALAAVSADGPQLGVVGALGTLGLGVMATHRTTRPLGLAAVGIVVVVAATGAPTWPSVPTAIVLDVGQGDAIVLQDPSGAAVLIDGGRDPRVLDRALRRNGVRVLDLVVVTHADSDHVGGLVELIRHGEVRAVWIPDHIDATDLMGDAVAAAEARSIPVTRVGRGTTARLGAYELTVVSPHRRFKAENDGSVALLATAGKVFLAPGDIGEVAQRELPDLRPDVMVVPHHGSATTDTAWLARTVGPIAVLSYGVNSFGHPAPEVVDVLDGLGVTVLHTHRDGDIAIPLG
jgi:competence protein ComEC